MEIASPAPATQPTASSSGRGVSGKYAIPARGAWRLIVVDALLMRLRYVVYMSQLITQLLTDRCQCRRSWAGILVQVTINRRLLIGRDGHLDQSEAYDLS